MATCKYSVESDTYVCTYNFISKPKLIFKNIPHIRSTVYGLQEHGTGIVRNTHVHFMQSCTVGTMSFSEQGK